MVEVIDLHTHVIPEAVLEWLANGDGPEAVRVAVGPAGTRTISHANGLQYEVFPTFTDPVAKLEQMDEVGIDTSVVSLAPELFGYEVPRDRTVAVTRMMSEALAEFASTSTERLHAVATLPMGSPARAVEELKYAVNNLGLVGAELGTSVGGRYLDDPEFDCVLQAAEDLEVTLMLHPHVHMTASPAAELREYHLANVIGNPLETSIAAARLIAGGSLDRHPKLVIQLPHGGGFLPYQIGRLDHAYRTNRAGATARQEPRSYLERFLFDTVLFEARALAFLLALVGPENVVFGSDLPFAEADVKTLGRIVEEYEPLGAKDVLHGNAHRVYRL